MNRATFFDIDGVLYKGFIIHEFPRYLTYSDILRKECFVEIDKHIQRYRRNEESYREAGLSIPRLYASGLKGKRVDVVKEKAREFMKMYKVNMFPYATALTDLMKRYGLTIAISGSPIEPISLLKNILGINLVYATQLKAKRGIYTGEVERNLIIREGKEAVFGKIVRDNKIDLSISFGFGDTEQDYSILSKVGIPIALNPNRELIKLVKRYNWLSFTSKDDIVSEVKKILQSQIR